MSGLPPLGSRHVFTTVRVRGLITDIELEPKLLT
jgi:hypothetical protein